MVGVGCCCLLVVVVVEHDALERRVGHSAAFFNHEARLQHWNNTSWRGEHADNDGSSTQEHVNCYVVVLRLKSGRVDHKQLSARPEQETTACIVRLIMLRAVFPLGSLRASELVHSPETPWKDDPPTSGRPVRVLASTVARVIEA